MIQIVPQQLLNIHILLQLLSYQIMVYNMPTWTVQGTQRAREVEAVYRVTTGTTQQLRQHWRFNKVMHSITVIFIVKILVLEEVRQEVEVVIRGEIMARVISVLI